MDWGRVLARVWIKLGEKSVPMKRKREESLDLQGCSFASQTPRAGLAVDSGFTLLDFLSDNNDHAQPTQYEKTGARASVKLGEKSVPMKRKREESLDLKGCSFASQTPRAGLAVDSGFTLPDSLFANHGQRFNFTECFSWASLCFSWLLKNSGVTALILGFCLWAFLNVNHY